MSALTKIAALALIAASSISPCVAGTSLIGDSVSRPNSPLLAGRPAGVRKAQSMSDLGTYGLAAGLVAVIIVATATGPGNSAVVSTTTTS
jgi:hypothetical protein